MTLTICYAPEALAGQPCGAHDEIVKELRVKYQETRRVMGVLDARNVMEIFMSPRGTWTVLVTNTRGASCITAAGDDWQEIPIATSGLDS
jgi:hypothetical protein